MSTCRIATRHCENCGNTDAEDLDTYDNPGLQGYSACCNEIVTDQIDCRLHHADIVAEPKPPTPVWYVWRRFSDGHTDATLYDPNSHRADTVEVLAIVADGSTYAQAMAYAR